MILPVSGGRELDVPREGQATRDCVAVEEPLEVRVNGASFAPIVTPGENR